MADVIDFFRKLQVELQKVVDEAHNANTREMSRILIHLIDTVIAEETPP